MAIIPLDILIPAVYSAHPILSLQAWRLECVQNVTCFVHISICVYVWQILMAYTGVWP